MRVALCIRNDWMRMRGGDTTQLLKTRQALMENYGVEFEVIDDPDTFDAKTFDLCHVFNVQKIEDTRKYIECCKARNVKLVLSSIFWDFSNILAYKFMVNYLHLSHLTPRRLRFFKRLLKGVAMVSGKPVTYTTGYRDYLRQVMEDVDILLPNSREELRILADVSRMEFSRLSGKSRIVVNSGSFEDTCNKEPVSEPVLPDKKFVLQVGQIHPGKNQLSLVKALEKDLDYAIVFAGNRSANPQYSNVVEKLAKQRGDVYFLDEVPREALRTCYEKATIHVLPSLGETTGLVSLEALECGCRAVVSAAPYSPYESYFKEFATPTDPLRPTAIRESIFSELAVHRDMRQISAKVRSTFSWENAARETYQGYLDALSVREVSSRPC